MMAIERRYSNRLFAHQPNDLEAYNSIISHPVIATGRDPICPANDRPSDKPGSRGPPPFVMRQAGHNDREFHDETYLRNSNCLRLKPPNHREQPGD